jgi:hypothetical protein
MVGTVISIALVDSVSIRHYWIRHAVHTIVAQPVSNKSDAPFNSLLRLGQGSRYLVYEFREPCSSNTLKTRRLMSTSSGRAAKLSFVSSDRGNGRSIVQKGSCCYTRANLRMLSHRTIPCSSSRLHELSTACQQVDAAALVRKPLMFRRSPNEDFLNDGSLFQRSQRPLVRVVHQI